VGRTTRIEAHEHEHILSVEEETELVGWISQHTARGYPPKPSTIREMADEFRSRVTTRRRN
jgi:hypothetical protein